MNSSAAWSITDASILIPVVSNNGSLENNMIVGEMSEGATSMGHTLLLGLNKNLFGETAGSKDVIFVQHPNSETANLQVDNIPVEVVLSEDKANESYLISFVDSSKESSWEDTQIRSIRRTQKDVFNSGPCGSSLFLTKDSVSDREPAQVDYKSVLNETTQGCSANVDIEKSLLTTLVQKKDHSLAEYTDHDLTEKNMGIFEKTQVPQQEVPLKEIVEMKNSDKVSEKGAPDAGETGSELNTSKTRRISRKEMKVLREEEKKKRAHAPGKRKCCYSDSELSETEDNVQHSWSVELDLANIQTMTDLVGQLKKYEFIDEDFAMLILRGVAEMKIDILQELKTGSCSESSSVSFSYELLAFAFLLYYHKREVYHFMSYSWKSAWPTVEKLMEWKKLVNSIPKKQTKKKRILNK